MVARQYTGMDSSSGGRRRLRLLPGDLARESAEARVHAQSTGSPPATVVWRICVASLTTLASGEGVFATKRPRPR